MGKTKEQTGAIRYVVGRGRSKTLRIATKDDPEIIYGWLREVYIDVPYKRKTPAYERIKRFRLKPDADISSVPKSAHLSYIANDGIRGFYVNLGHGITLNICFPKDLSKWNDFDYVLVLDEDFGQPYGPFYHYMGNKISAFPALLEIVNAYNREMSKLEYLEEINGNS